MEVVIEKIKSGLAKVSEGAVTSKSKKTRGPSIEVLASLDSDRTKMIYLSLYYFYHCVIRIVSLWGLYNFLYGL
jgi:hypothetical protein